MSKVNEKYKEEYFKLIIKHIKIRLIGAIIFTLIGITLIAIAYVGYKKIIEMNELIWFFSGLAGFTSIGLAIMRLTHRTHWEHEEIENFKLIRTIEKYKDIIDE